MKYLLVMAATAVAFAGAASAAPADRLAQHRVQGQVLPKATGSIATAPRRAGHRRDAQGRDLRSSTRGNAQFPERAPEAQNLGGTAGGPKF